MANKLDVELRQGKVSRKWYIALLGKNGEIVMTSQRYWSRENAHRAMVHVMSSVLGTRKV